MRPGEFTLEEKLRIFSFIFFQHGHFDPKQPCTLLPIQVSKSSLNIYGEKYSEVVNRFQKKMVEIRNTWPIEEIVVKQSCQFIRDIGDKNTLIGQFFAKCGNIDQAYFHGRYLKQSLKGGRVELLVNSVTCEFGSQYEAAFADFNCK